jgi:signal transduction histidine kinase
VDLPTDMDGGADRALLARYSRSVGVARSIGLVGLADLVLVLAHGHLPEPLWPFGLQAVVTVLVTGFAFFSKTPSVISGVLLLALSAGAFGFLVTHGAGGGTGAFLVALPAAASVLLRSARSARWVTVVTALVFTISVWLLPAKSSSWVLALFGFLALATVSVLLLGAVLRDFDRVFGEYEEASFALATAGRLRIAAEEARDKALLLRSESRSIEALGVVAGSVVHDLNNMAQVIRTWTGEILSDEMSVSAHDAARSIAGSCDRLTTLANDVLALGQVETESSIQTSLSDVLPKAARALRRYVPESIRLVMDQSLPDNLPSFPLTGADLVHLILEAAACVGVTSATSGTLMLAAPHKGEVDIGAPHSGMSRYPVVLLLELRRDGRTRLKAAPWRDVASLPEEGKDVLCTSEVCVLLFAPYPDAVVIALDLFPTLHADSAPSLRFLPSASALLSSGEILK